MNTLAYRLSPQQKALLQKDTFTGCLLKFEINTNIPVDEIKELITAIASKYVVFKLNFFDDNNEQLQSVEEDVRVQFVEDAQPDTSFNAALQVAILPSIEGYKITFAGHPLCVDIQSLLLVQEQLLCSLQQKELKEEEIDYMQFSEWQYQLLEDEGAMDGRQFWQQQQGAPSFKTRLELQPVGNIRFATVNRDIPIALGNAVVEKATVLEMNAESIFLAAYLKMIKLLSSSNDYSIGLECNGREFDELNNTIGALSKLVPLAVRENGSFDISAVSELLEQTRSYQFYYNNGNAHFDYQFGFVNAGANEIEELRQLLQLCKLKCQVISAAGKIQVTFVYDEKYFVQRDINYLSDLYLHCLNECINGKKQDVLSVIYSGAPAIETEKDIVKRFRNIAASFPGNIAIQTPATSLTYQQLDTLSDNIAAQLQSKHQVKKGDFVGLLMDTGEWMPAGILGILKAGAACLPLDIDNPRQRLLDILEDAAPKCILTTGALQGKLESIKGEIVLIDKLENSTDAIADNFTLAGEETAYMIYTSGTTAKPKGVMVTGSNLLNYVDWLTSEFGISAQDKSTLQSSYAYDLGYTSLWGCLLNGAALYLVQPEQRHDADWLVDYINSNQITYLKLTPSVFYLLLQASNIHTLKSSALRLIFLGGEKIDVKSLQQFKNIKPNITFVNHYGPTETTIGTIFHTIPADSLDTFTRRPVIGKPIAGNQVLLLNHEDKICVPGETGEICIAGNGVAKGYYNRETLNSEKFIQYSVEGNSLKIYRTGDLGYSLPDGNIVIEGRKDNQVKIRGHRIELDELKHALNKAGLNEVILKLVLSSGFGEDLVCYYRATVEIDNAALRAQLTTLVPDYMVPSFFVRIATIPLTANGKVDMNALPDPYKIQIAPKTEAGAMTETEKQVANIWTAVLGVPVTGNTDFFVAGGDSIKAIQIVAKLNKQGLKCQLADIFNYTTVSSLAAFINPEDVAETSKITEDTIADAVLYKLSPMQESMFFQYKMYPESKANLVIRQFDINGDVNVDALRESLKQAFNHYDILRTQLVTSEDNHTSLMIRAGVEDVVEIIDITGFTDAESEARIEEEKDKLLQQGFNLESDVLLRIKLFRLKNKYVLLWNYHHIIMDGWCFNIIVKEIMGAYAAICKNTEYTWAPYTSFTKYLEWIEQQPAGEAADFWESYLKDYTNVATIPSLQNVKVDTYEPGLANFFINNNLSEQMQAFCNDKKITLNHFLQTAWGIVLGKYNNVDDVVYGITVAGRPYEIDGYEYLLGLFINTLPLRVKWDAHTTVNDLLIAIRNNFYKIQPYQNYSLSKIQSHSALKKDLLNHVLIFENYPLTSVASEAEETGISISSTDSFGQVNYDFAILAYPGDNICITFMYNGNVYPAEQVKAIYSHLMQTIKMMMTAPDKKVMEIDIVPDTEKKTLLEWSIQPGDFDREKTIVDYINEVGVNFPNHIAVEDKDSSISYSELNSKANALASWLLKNYSIQPGDKIGIFLPPSVDTIVTILGIIKTGAAYVPLDVEYPAERIAFMIENSDSKLLLTSAAYKQALGNEQIDIVDINDITADDIVTLPVVQQDDVAYIIYTSGSTGTPKGCQVTHENLMRLLKQKTEWLTFNEDDVWVLTHSYTFDFSAWEIFGALVNGSKLYIPQRDEVRDTAVFASLIKTKGATILNQTPLAFYQLVETIKNTTGSLSGYAARMVVFAGEKLDFVKLLPWTELAGSEQVQLYNLYGITETTVHSSWHLVTHDEIRKATGKSNIGLPMPSTSIYVVNKDFQLCPVGVFGELVVGGEGVCKGYYKLDELTQKRFIGDPFAGNGTVYKSGDVGRWLPEGTLEYSERMDNQVQIRGFRVEPGEVLFWLQKHPSVKQVFVMAPVIDGNTALVAYIVPAGEQPEVKALRHYLAEHLPQQFIPQYFIFLSEFPVTSNGKVDKKKLPLPSKAAKHEAGNISADVIERTLISIWEKELECSVSSEDDFFELGGHSLKAMRMISEVQKQFNIDIPAVQLYNQPVLKDLAATIKQALGQSYAIVESHHIVLKKADTDKTMFFLPPAVGYAFGFAPLAKALEDWNVYGINFIEENTFEAMASVVNELQPEGTVVLCGFSASGSMCFHVARILEAMGRTVQALILLDSRRFLQPEPLQPEEIKNIAEEYIRDPRAQAYITSPVMKAAMRSRIEASISFIHSLQDDGQIQSNIYYIRSETNRNNDSRVTDWQGVTTGKVHLYEGSGQHIAMLDEPHLQENVRVYREIIESLN